MVNITTIYSHNDYCAGYSTIPTRFFYKLFIDLLLQHWCYSGPGLLFWPSTTITPDRWFPLSQRTLTTIYDNVGDRATVIDCVCQTHYTGDSYSPTDQLFICIVVETILIPDDQMTGLILEKTNYYWLFYCDHCEAHLQMKGQTTA